MSIKIKKLILLIIFFYATAVAAKSFHDLGDHFFQTVDGSSLEDKVITDVMQDKAGFIWLGTQKSLIRYDGYRFRSFSPIINGEPVQVFVRNIWIDHNDNIWMGTELNGLFQFEKKTETFKRFLHDPDDEFSINSDEVFALEGDGEKGVWVGTQQGLNYLNLTTLKFKPVNFLKNAALSSDKKQRSLIVHSLFVDSHKKLWIGTASGVRKIDTDSQNIEPIKYSEQADSQISDSKVISFYESNNGTIWIGTVKQGIAWSKDGQMIESGMSNQSVSEGVENLWIYSINEVFDGEIWLGTIGNGIVVIDAKQKTIKREIRHDPVLSYSINLDWVTSLKKDRAGLLWIGTWGGALNLFNPNNDTFRSMRYSPNSKGGISASNVTTMLETSNQELWVAIASQGIEVLDLNNQVIAKFESKPGEVNSLHNGYVTSLIETKNNDIWVGTQVAGIYRYNRKENNFKRFLPQLKDIVTLHYDESGFLWIGTDLGVYRYQFDTQELLPIHTKNNKAIVSRLLEFSQQKDGRIWIMSQDYLLTVPPQSTQAIIVNKYINATKFNGQLNGLRVDSQNKLWLSIDNSLYSLINVDDEQANLKLEIKSMKEGLYNMLSDNQGRIWSFNHFFDPENQKQASLGASDGVDIGIHWNHDYHAGKNGLLYFGGTKGLVIIDPEKFDIWDYEPEIVISTLKVGGKLNSVPLDKEIELNAEDKDFSIEFSALDYLAAEKIKYEYRLNGYDKKWFTTSSDYRVANYTNLSPGQYSFDIRVINRMNHTYQKNNLLNISVLPNWYQTWWFRVFVAFVSCSLLYMVYLVRVKQLRQNKIVLARQVKKRNSELQMINEIGKELNACRNVDVLFSQLHSRISRILDVYAFAIGISDRISNTVEFKLVIEDNVYLPPYSESLSDKNRLSAYCITKDKELFLRKSSERKKYVKEAVEPTVGKDTESIIYLPLKSYNKTTIGCLTIQSLICNAYSYKQLDILRTLANYAAIAIDNASVYQALEESSVTDQLTGLKNRRFLQKQIQSDIAKVVRDYSQIDNFEHVLVKDNADLIFYMIDLDFFKQVNDTYGHSAGDAVLMQVKDLMIKVFRESDYFIRWGGEEFLVIARFVNRQCASKLAERLRKAIEEHEFILDDHQKIKKTCSIGFVAFPLVLDKPEVCTWLEVIDIADRCLYAAKNSSRNAWVGLSQPLEEQNDALVSEVIRNIGNVVVKQKINIESSLNDTSSLRWD